MLSGNSQMCSVVDNACERKADWLITNMIEGQTRLTIKVIADTTYKITMFIEKQSE